MNLAQLPRVTLSRASEWGRRLSRWKLMIRW
jgi:hypothetical protein